MYSLGVKLSLLNKIKKPNKNATFVFGLQKSGTSAITGLLAAYTGKSATIDTKYLWEPYRTQLLEDELTIKQLVNRFSYPFSKEIIKEPSATFFIDKVSEFFSLEKFIFIVRNPFDNIRSILNRLNLPGDEDHIDPSRIHPNWRYIFKSEGQANYIDTLIANWLAANDQPGWTSHPGCLLIRYEDFNADKEGVIGHISNQLGFGRMNDISDIVDKQFQPKGSSPDSLVEFFGQKNFEKIASKCEKVGHELGYQRLA
ncbi:Sulfotransferase family protein [Imperialibacter sp. EC-SDR9]|nr:Sulfotransferase family protein [Imperialibacter sp. 89]CAD5261130.1 Sulfotransferase family protein [Imperialibacter sp. 75]VVT03658.1 Sulfotransferase family protein [Imperialibacter sp. EC-SDR9]